jgi:hypothetical protein
MISAIRISAGSHQGRPRVRFGRKKAVEGAIADSSPAPPRRQDDSVSGATLYLALETRLLRASKMVANLAKPDAAV